MALRKRAGGNLEGANTQMADPMLRNKMRFSWIQMGIHGFCFCLRISLCWPCPIVYQRPERQL